MFGAKEEGYNNEGTQADDTIIGSTIRIEGDLVSNGSIIVEGEVVGSLKTDKDLRVGQSAKVKADVKAAEALIAGTVDGNITVDNKLELTETARVTGDINAKTLIIQSGAVFNGSCTMEEGVVMSNKSVSKETQEEGSQDEEKVEEEIES